MNKIINNPTKITVKHSMIRQTNDIAIFVTNIREAERTGQYIADKIPTLETISVVPEHYRKIRAQFKGITVYYLKQEYQNGGTKP